METGKGRGQCRGHWSLYPSGAQTCWGSLGHRIKQASELSHLYIKGSGKSCRRDICLTSS